MFENNKKGWHGAYSISGKMTAQNFIEIMHKDKIFKNEERKIKIRDFFAPDIEVNNIDYLYDDIKSFQIYKKNDNHFKHSFFKAMNKNNNKNITEKSNNINIKTFFYKKPNNTEDAAKDKYYNVNYDLVSPKTLTGIKWNIMPGRKNQKKFINIDIENNNEKKCDKYLEDKNINYPLNKENKCFVNMDKYTKRGNFIDLKDIRIKYDKPYHKNKLMLLEESKNYNMNNKSNPKTYKNNNDINKNKISLFNIFNYNHKKNENKKLLLKKSLPNKRKSNLILKQSFSEKIKVPNFKNYLSRQYFEKLCLKKRLEKNNYLIY